MNPAATIATPRTSHGGRERAIEYLRVEEQFAGEPDHRHPDHQRNRQQGEPDGEGQSLPEQRRTNWENPVLPYALERDLDQRAEGVAEVRHERVGEHGNNGRFAERIAATDE